MAVMFVDFHIQLLLCDVGYSNDSLSIIILNLFVKICPEIKGKVTYIFWKYIGWQISEADFHLDKESQHFYFHLRQTDFEDK